ncbi:MAG: cupin domain-containing protein [Nitrospinaceae bacterium]|jgi:quercetin dioxygenase-like cupin family protein|nr:cupin domain-containing protein [Nitrospinaceae bacterium]MBT3821523.1 cupin domain-containing protein [Nitrospinaceae bacterium]MBT4093951.1 cupin domain-containing protein [Nitrospinaceae bacterium]MBT5949350.1 cupin domain-containing protein [Nitrospinaceae bacterium]MBT7858132.1 cupin domain-containing protein [Nitrospinaceae bacterium]
MPFHRWDDMKPRNLVKTTDSEGNLILGELTTVTRQIQPPGKATRPHTHGCEQMIQILEGAGWFRVGDEEKTVGPGEVVHIPMGALHELKNEGEDRLVYLSFKNRSEDWPPPEAIGP